MGSISAIVSDLNFGRAKLLQAIEGLSQRELTQLPIYGDWTIKDVLAHVLGWDQRVLRTLPLMVQNRASEVPSVEVDEYNAESVAAWRERTLAEVLVEVESTHRQILDFISTLDHKEIDTRRERHGQTITIRSYVIDVMTEHERQHAAEIEQWRRKLEQSIDPDALTRELAGCRAAFVAAIAGLSQADRLDKRAAEAWSVKDVVGHIADWEQLMLDAARYIHDPSLPKGPLMGQADEDWNEILAARRSGNSWNTDWLYLTAVQQAVDDFIARLRPGDWTLRGPYPWPKDQGTLAELVWHMSQHYADHLPDLENWKKLVQT